MSCHSDEHGDRPRASPDVPELKKAVQLFERKESSHWDFDVSFVVSSPFFCLELNIYSTSYLSPNVIILIYFVVPLK